MKQAKLTYDVGVINLQLFDVSHFGKIVEGLHSIDINWGHSCIPYFASANEYLPHFQSELAAFQYKNNPQVCTFEHGLAFIMTTLGNSYVITWPTKIRSRTLPL